MKKYIHILLILCFSNTIYPQIIRGRIQDESTRGPVCNAAIYYNGTFKGTYSDTAGYFEIDISGNIFLPLIISALGYYSTSVSDLSPDKYYTIYLKPKLFELDEVVVKAEGDRNSRRERRADIKMFRRVFIGETANARKCKIINEDDLIFRHSSRGDTVEAFSDKPLSIENDALGYTISYYLDSFYYSERRAWFYFSGNIRFIQDSIIRERRLMSYEDKREAAFTGSRMHFFRALWNNELDSTGFRVLDKKHNALANSEFVIQSDSLSKYLKNKGTLTVVFSGKEPMSFIYFNRDSVFFDRFGNFDGSGIRWDGQMANQRIADQLPYEYLSKSARVKKSPAE